MIVVFVSFFRPEIIEKRLFDSKKRLFETMIAVRVGSACCLNGWTAMTISPEKDANFRDFIQLGIGAVRISRALKS